jgi:hypothetical protein
VACAISHYQNAILPALKPILEPKETQTMLQATNLPFTTVTEEDHTATVYAYDGKSDSFVGVVHYSDNVTLPVCWNSGGWSLFSDGTIDVQNDRLVDRTTKVRQQFNALDPETKELLERLRHIFAAKKIAGIKHIRAITGFGLYEAKMLYEEVL